MPRTRYQRGAQAGWPWSKKKTEDERFHEDASRRFRQAYDRLQREYSSIGAQIRQKQSEQQYGSDWRKYERLAKEIVELQEKQDQIEQQIIAEQRDAEYQQRLTAAQAWSSDSSGRDAVKAEIAREKANAEEYIRQHPQSSRWSEPTWHYARPSGFQPAYSQGRMGDPIYFGPEPEQSASSSEESSEDSGSSESDVPAQMGGTMSRKPKIYTRHVLRNPRTGRFMSTKRR